MNSKNKSLFLYKAKYEKQISSWIETQATDGFIAMNLEDVLPPKELGSRIHFIKPWEYLEHEEILRIDAEAYRIVDKCYCIGGVDMTASDGISLGQLVEYEMVHYFVQSIKAITLLLSLQERAGVGNIVLFGDDTQFEKAALLLSQMGVLKATVIGQHDALPKGRVSYGRLDFRGQIKQFLLRTMVQSHNLLGRMLGRENRKETFVIESGDRSLPLIKKIVGDRALRARIMLLGNLRSAWWNCFKHARRVSITYGREDYQGELKEDRITGMVAALTEALQQRIHASEVVYLKELVEKEMPLQVHRWLIYAAENDDQAKRLLQQCKGSTLIVVHDFKGLQRALVARAKHLGLKTIVLQHGAYGFYPSFVAPISDVVTIWGPRWGGWLKERLKVDERRIVVANDCYYESYLWQGDTRQVSRPRALRRIPKEKRIVLFAYQPNVSISAYGFPTFSELLVSDVCRAFRNEEDISLILKLRPDDPVSKGIELAARAGAGNVSVVTKADNLALLRSVEVVLTRESTLAFEAALLGVPVVALDVPPSTLDRVHNPFIRDEFSIRVQGIEEAVKITRRLLSDSEFRDQVLSRQKAALEDYLVSEPTLLDVLKHSDSMPRGV